MPKPLVSFPAYIAERYLKTRKKGAFVRVMVRFAMVGVALGVFVLVLATGFFNGFAQEIQANLMSASAHFSVVPRLWPEFKNTQQDLQCIRSVDGVAGASPYRMDHVLARGNLPGMPPSALLVWGVDPGTIRSISSIYDSVTPGRIEQLKDGEVLLGEGAARRLHVQVGEQLVLTFLSVEQGLAGAMPRSAVFTIAGTYRSRIQEYDDNWACIPLETSMRLAEVTEASFIGVRVKHLDRIDAMKAPVLAALGQARKPVYEIADLREQNRLLFGAIKLQKKLAAVILSLITLVAAFNIVSGLVLLITEKRRDLGVLLSLGATPAQIQRAFELQGLRIAMVGTAWGLALAIPFCLVADHFRLIRLPENLYNFITYLPCRLHWLDLLLVTIFPIAVGWWASRFPARRAASVDPVDALRAE